MKAEIKELWEKALISGRYDKGDIYQKQVWESGPILHCVLGVLGQIAVDVGASMEKPRRIHRELIVYDFVTSAQFDSDEVFLTSDYLPPHIQTWSGLYAISNGPHLGEIPLKVDGVVRSITYWNDNKNLSFKQMAKAIHDYY